MIERQIDELLAEHIYRLLGIRSDQIVLPLDLVSITCICLIVSREQAVCDETSSPASRYTGETFLDDLTANGIHVNGNSLARFNGLIQQGYIIADDDECYRADDSAVMLDSLLNRLFPEMQGMFFISYFVQTIEEVASDRKTASQAMEQAAQMLHSKGMELSFPSLSVDEKKFLKRMLKRNNQSAGRLSKRDKLLNVLSIRMGKMGGLPSLKHNGILFRTILARDERSLTPMVDGVITDLPMMIKLVEHVNTRFVPREKQGVVSIPQAMVTLGYDQAKQFLEEALQTANVSGSLDKEYTCLCYFAYLKSLIARHIATRLDLDNIEDVCTNVMFFHLGQILVMHYLPEAYTQVKRLCAKKEEELSSASINILGMTYEGIGVKIATEWRLPYTTIESMKISKIKQPDASKVPLGHAMPSYVNSLWLDIARMEIGMIKTSPFMARLSEHLNIPRNDFVRMFELAWSAFEFSLEDYGLAVERAQFLREIVTFFE